MEEKMLTCERAWELNRDRLIKMAYRNTFNTVKEAFETGWNLAVEVNSPPMRERELKQ